MITQLIASDLCVGCGACTVYAEGKMKWNTQGFLVPACPSELPQEAAQVCPFNLSPAAEVKTEDQLAAHFLTEATQYEAHVGKYIATYVGYSSAFRSTSSSGGMATYVVAQLLEQGEIDYVVSVGEAADSFYTYKLSRTQEELLETSQTKYYPVSMAQVLKKIEQLEGRFAVVGTACFVKAIRLLQYYRPAFQNKIRFVVGIICGGQKSKYYTDFLASKLQFAPNTFSHPQFRIKDIKSYALDYCFGVNDKAGKLHQLRMNTMGDMWGSGLFKNRACDFCDDVLSELADISLGDAWIKPYKLDGRGTNIIITRSKLAQQLVAAGMHQQELHLEELPLEQLIESQQGSFNHRRQGLGYRISCTQQQGELLPPKRYGNTPISFDFKWVQQLRLQTRAKSLEAWAAGGAQQYEAEMPPLLQKLKRYTKLNHRIRKIKRKLSL